MHAENALSHGFCELAQQRLTKCSPHYSVIDHLRARRTHAPCSTHILQDYSCADKILEDPNMSWCKGVAIPPLGPIEPSAVLDLEGEVIGDPDEVTLYRLCMGRPLYLGIYRFDIAWTLWDLGRADQSSCIGASQAGALLGKKSVLYFPAEGAMNEIAACTGAD